MSRRYVDPDLWLKLFGTPPSTKLVAAYLHATSPNPAGIFRIRMEEVAMKTGLKIREIEAALTDLHDRDLILWDADASIVFIQGYANVQGMNPKVSRSINNELIRLGPSPLTVRASQIPQLRAQDPTGWDRLSIAYGEGMHTLLSVCLVSSQKGKGESEGGGESRRAKPVNWVEGTLDLIRDHWPRDDQGRLYRFDRADARAELKKLGNGSRPVEADLVAGLEAWKRSWDSNGYQHKASTFIANRLWEQAPEPARPKAKPVTTRPLIRDLTGGKS